MTYIELSDFIYNHPECWKQDVTIYDAATDEFYPMTNVKLTDESEDRLDENHLFLEY